MESSLRPQPSKALRTVPAQPRARATVEHLLDTARTLLVEVGMERFNTNLLAERAGVRVRTVYRYFPNKIAIAHALAEQLAVAWDSWFDDRLLADPHTDLGSAWSSYIDAFVAGVAQAPAGLAIRRALHATPELQHLEVEDKRRLAARAAAALQLRQPALDPDQIRIAAQVLLETAVAVLDHAFERGGADAARLLAELKSMQTTYLEQLLEPPTNSGEKP